MSRMAIDGHCPACGKKSLGVPVFGVRGPTARVKCFHPDCPDPDVVAVILEDSEIHHIVRIEPSGYFNTQHPIRERARAQLLDCAVHEGVNAWLDGMSFAEHKAKIDTTWRATEVDGEWTFEQLTDHGH